MKMQVQHGGGGAEQGGIPAKSDGTPAGMVHERPHVATGSTQTATTWVHQHLYSKKARVLTSSKGGDFLSLIP